MRLPPAGGGGSRSRLRLGGVLSCSLSDFPGRVARVFFVSGCNLRCPFCHNPSLVLPQGEAGDEWREVSELVGAMADGLLDGVVISGGEPTLQEEAVSLLAEMSRAAGLAVKLDTNGTRPDVLERMLSHGVLDYVAMDSKQPFRGSGKLGGAAAGDAAAPLIARSVRLLIEACMKEDVAVEFRTTLASPWLSEDEMREMAFHLEEVCRETADCGAGAKRRPLLVLQPFRDERTLEPAFPLSNRPWSPSAMERLVASLDAECAHLDVRTRG